MEDTRRTNSIKESTQQTTHQGLNIKETADRGDRDRGEKKEWEVLLDICHIVPRHIIHVMYITALLGIIYVWLPMR